MTFRLNPDLEARIEELIASGRFSSPEEVIRAGVDSLPTEAATGLGVLHPQSNISPELTARLRKVRKKNLIELFRDSPFAGLEIDFPRDPAPMREVEFE
jgi:Arc/MetJ-type ribon-helix-helix transcriptional regulator